MGTFTASILVGSGHPNDGGISPMTTLYLNEGSKISWVMRGARSARGPRREMTWICTVDHTLEDAILMIAYFVLENSPIRELVKEFAPEFREHQAFLYDEFTDSQRKHLYSCCHRLENFPKLIVTTFRGSYLSSKLHQLPALTTGDLEICTAVYSRLYSPWTNKVVEEGSIAGEDVDKLR